MLPTYSRTEILQYLKLDDSPDLWQEGWNISEQSFIEADLHFIDPTYIRQQCDILELENAIAEALVSGVRSGIAHA